MTLIPNNYDGLISAIVALAEDDSQEFLNYIPTAIFLAEERIVKEIDLEVLTLDTVVTASANSQFLAKPQNYRLANTLVFETSSSVREIPEKKTESFVLDYWPDKGVTGVPKYYSDRDGSFFRLAPTPASAYRFSLSYVEKPERLSPTVSVNKFTQRCPDALFYATMSNVAEFMKDYNTRAVWESKYETARDGVNNQARRERKDEQSGVPEYPNVNTLAEGRT